jgi:hypothetical protein
MIPMGSVGIPRPSRLKTCDPVGCDAVYFGGEPTRPLTERVGRTAHDRYVLFAGWLMYIRPHSVSGALWSVAVAAVRRGGEDTGHRSQEAANVCCTTHQRLLG